MYPFITLLAVFVSCWSLLWAQSSISITYYEPGTNCTVAANERVGWMRTNACLPESSAQYCQGRANECGMMGICDPNKVTFEYWFVAGNQCTRNPPELTVSYVPGACLPSTAGYPYKNYESVLGCDP